MTPFEHELAGHAQALRAVARMLVGDQHADDLVQETSLQVLRQPPPAAVAPRPWLLGILRHRAAKLRRGEQRRTARERAHADVGHGASAEPRQLAEHKETAERLHRALMALPEPYQGTLWLRFFQDLTPSAIAERTGAPLATVKSRLQRGLDLLRRDFAGDRDDAECRRALAAAFGLEPWAAVTAAATGALLMTTILKLGLAGGIAVAAGLFALNSADAPTAPTGTGAGARTDVATATSNLNRAPEAGALATDAARTTVPTADAVSDPEPAPVRIRVVDAFDRAPLPHYALWLVGPDRQPHPGDVLATDDNGELQLPGQVRSKASTLRLLDDPDQELRASPVRRIAENAWPDASAALELAVASGPTYHLVFADGAPPEGELKASLAHERDFAQAFQKRGEEQRVRAGSPPWVRFDPTIANPSEIGAGPWVLSVHSNSEDWLAEGPVDTVRGRQRAPVVLRSVECGRIEVSVTVDGRPLGEAGTGAEFHTSIYRRGDDGNATGRDHTQQIDAKCPTAHIRLLQPGRYRVYVGNRHGVVRTHDVEVRAHETSLVTADFPSRGDLAALRVVVRSQSGTRDLGFVSVYARRIDNGNLRTGVASAPGATAAAPTFTDLEPGEWDIELSPTPSLPPWDATVKRVAANAGTVEFTCLDGGAPPPGYAQVHVVDARGAPVGCAGVTTFVSGQQHYGTNADGDGNAVIGPYLSGSTVQVLVRAADHRPAFVDVVPAADPQPVQRVALSPGWGTMLVVVEPSASIAPKPLADVEVLCDGVRAATTDARGLALLASDTPPRRIELRRSGYAIDYGSIDARTGAFDGGTQLPFFVVMKPVR